MKETWEYIVRTMKNTASLRKARPAKLMGFSPKLNILPEPQRALWKELAATPKQFVLYGGTALALRLGHRVSEDFDFFTNRTFEPRAHFGAHPVSWRRQGHPTSGKHVDLRARSERSSSCVVLWRTRAQPRIGSRLGTRQRLADCFPFGCLQDARWPSCRDAPRAKDYRDIAALLEHGVSLHMALAAAKAIYGEQFDPRATLRALTYFADGDLPRLSSLTQNALQRAVQSVELDKLPRLTGKRDLTRQGRER